MSLKIVEQTSSRLKLHELNALQETPYEKGTWFGIIGCLLPFLLVCGGIPSLFGLYLSYDSLFSGGLLQVLQLRIINFIENPQEISWNIPIPSEKQWEGLLVGIFLIIGFGLTSIVGFMKMMISITSTSICTFDKILDRAVIEHKNLFYIRVLKCSLHEISDVQVEEKTRSDENRKYKVYRLVLVLASGKRLPLTPFPDEEGEPNQRLVDYIREFLNLGRSI